MGSEGNQRELTLEERIGLLEARLERLEGAADVVQDLPARPPSAAAAPAMPIMAAAVPADPPAPPARASAPAHIAPETRPAGSSSGWVEPARWTRPTVSIKLPNLAGSFDDLEARLAGRALAWVGGLALVLGAIFFLSLAFSRGWIGPELRVIIGLIAGSVCIAAGAAFMERDNRLLGHVLAPVGLAVISVSLVGATRLYGLVPVQIGLAAALLSAIAVAVIAVRTDSQIVAAFGLISVLGAPPLMGAAPDMATLAFIAVVLVGTTGVALWRSWSWLSPAAFLLSAPQVAAWVVGHPVPSVGLLGIGLFWLLNIVGAGGEEYRRHRDDLSPSSATLLIANVAFLIWAGFVVLSGDLLVYRGFFLVLIALGQLGIGGFFVVRDGDRNLFGLLAMGTGIAVLTMAAPIELGASVVPIAWSAEAVALAWVAVRRGHPYSALVSGILYALTGGYLVQLYLPRIESTAGLPFAAGPAASLGFFAAAVAFGVWIVRDRSLRSGLAAFGLLVAGLCVPAVLDEPATVSALSVLMVVGVAVWRAIPALPSAPIAWQVEGLIPRTQRRIGEWRQTIDALLPVTTALLGVLATLRLIGPVYGSSAGVHPIGIPFADPAGAALAVYLASLAAVAWISGRSRTREPLSAIGLLVAGWASVSEFDGVALIAAWSVLMVVGLAAWRGLAALPHESPIAIVRTAGVTFTLDLVLPAAAVLSGVVAAIHALAIELPIARFGAVPPPNVPFTDEGAVAAAILTAAVLAAGLAIGGVTARRASILVAGGVVAYAIPFEVYAWAVTVLWAGLSGLSLVLVRVISRVDRTARHAFILASAIMVTGAAAVAVAIVAPPSRLVVAASVVDPVVALQSSAALAAVALGLVGLARFGGSDRSNPVNERARWIRWTWIAAGVTVVYLMSVAVVDAVGTQIGGSVSTDELRTQGQVALSVLWAFVGAVAFVSGLRLRVADLRHGGLALLAVATAKVFLFDLSALDVAYRVISLIVLGLLLLSSAWLWQRQQPRPSPTGGDPGS
jgi:uncharacterized membrane protein